MVLLMRESAGREHTWLGEVLWDRVWVVCSYELNTNTFLVSFPDISCGAEFFQKVRLTKQSLFFSRH